MKKTFIPAFLLLTASGFPLRADFTSLNLGLDYHLRGVSAGDHRDRQDRPEGDTLGYYSQSARFYMTAWLNENVEAAFRLQSINVWGAEGPGSAAPLTRYPDADGTPFVEEAYIHLPRMFGGRVDVILGRQPIVIGDGLLVSSDNLGFNALRAKVRGPWRTELDLFTAKVAESLSPAGDDSDLKGVVFRARQADRYWDLGVIQETLGAGGDYVMSHSTFPFSATHVSRRFYDVRLFGDLKDAYYKLELVVQKGDAYLTGPGRVKIDGMGQKIELGAQKDTDKWGRFGVHAVYAQGTGDDTGSTGTDEAFRPTFARRWNGLQRSGYGSHFAATLSDAYDPAAPFTPGTTGLPPGVSGIRTTGLGIHSTQKVFWTGSLDYYTYEARVNQTGEKDLGAEIDAQVTFRYTGFVTFKGGLSLFFPGNAFGPNTSRVTRTSFEARVHF